MSLQVGGVQSHASLIDVSTPHIVADVPPCLEYAGGGTLTSASDYITMGGLDLDTDKMYILIIKGDNPTGADASVELFLNGDTTANHYYKQQLYATGTSVTARRNNNSDIFTAKAGQSWQMVITMVKTPDDYVKIIVEIDKNDPSTIDIYYAGVSWTSKTNVTSLTIQQDVANSIGEDATIYLYRPSRSL